MRLEAKGNVMTFLDNRIPPPLVALLIGILMWMVSDHAPQFVATGNGYMYAAAAALVFGACVSLAGIGAFRRARTTVNPLKPQTASSFVVTGIFRYSRNPMYVGLAAMLSAWAIYLRSPLALSGVALFILYMNRFQITPEERALESLFAEEFVAYKTRVRRWL